jgi:hypothetical protein
MIARPSAKFARPRVHVSLISRPYEGRNVCVISERQVRDHRGLNSGRDCKNHTHYTVAKVKEDVAQGEMTFLDRNGNPTPAQTRVATFTSNAARTWQKTQSGPVHAMQLKVGLKGRHVPAGQREPELVLA